MPVSPIRRLLQALDALQDRLFADPHLQAELSRACREFFAGGAYVPGSHAEQRFREWFLLERESDVLGCVPLGASPPRDGAELLADSLVGVFAVEQAQHGLALVRDLQNDTRLDLLVREHDVRAGDLLVGRLFPHGDGSLLPSPALAVYRPGDKLAAAFRVDVARLDLGRRLGQHELEHLLLHKRVPDNAEPAAPAVPLEHLEAQLDALLRAGGAEVAAAAVSSSLAVGERPGAVLGPLLDQLAFDSKVDLEQVRRVLLAIWNAHALRRAGTVPPPSAGSAPPPPPASPEPGETLGQMLARKLDEGLRQKRDVESLFAELEQLAGIDPEDDEDGDDPADGLLGAHALDDGDQDDADDDTDDHGDAADAGPTTPGDLQPLVQEYLWETQQEQAPAARLLQQFVALQSNAALQRTDLEQVTGPDLLRLLLQHWLAAPADARAQAVRSAFAEVVAFYRWAESTQEYELGAALRECEVGFVDHLDRLQAAGLQLGTGAPTAGVRPQLLHVEDPSPRGFGVRTDGGDAFWIDAGPAVAAHLRAGDLLLAALRPAAGGSAVLLGPVVALPAAVGELLG